MTIRLSWRATWGGALYNLAAMGHRLIFAEFPASHADRRRIGPAENVTMSRPDPVVRDSVTRGRRRVLGSLRSNIRMLLALGVLSASTVWAVDSGQYPENFRRWVHVGTGVILPGGAFPENEQGMHHIFANQKAVDGYASGDFPDGSVIVYELREAQQKNGIIFEGERRRVDVMIKASSLYNKTGGWKFERFLGNQQAQDAVHDSGASCFQCHANANAHGFVFSQLR